MKITILGSGTAAPRINRNMSGYLLEANGKKILLDSGPGTIRQLLKLKVNLLDIDNIFYTHLHNDHINDLGAIIWSNNYGTYRKKPLNLYGPQGFKKYYKIFMGKILKPDKLIYGINVKEMKNGSIVEIPINKKIDKKYSIINKNNNYTNIIIKSIKSRHTKNSVSYRIEYDGKSIVYSGDTDYSREIIEISKNADLLILECSFPDKKKGHLTPALCGRIATKANAKKLVLTHFYPECDKVDVKKQCGKEFDGKVILDFMAIKV
jgi:ribonuclease BN (tRNA processing enzyme)